jgi:hypothetical protein
MPKINIEVWWNDDSANIEENNEGELEVQIPTKLYNNMDPLFKLDFLTDMERWVQEEVDRVHEKELTPHESLAYSYAMRCPRSSTQIEQDETDPKLAKERKNLGRQIHLDASSRIGQLIKGGKNGRSSKV